MSRKIEFSSVLITIMIAIGFLSVCYRITAKNIIYDILGFRAEWFLNSIVTDDNFDEPKKADIVWSEVYPFAEDGAYEQTAIVDSISKSSSVSSQLSGALGKIYTMLEKYTSDYFTFTDLCERISKQFSNFLGNRLNTDAYGVNQLFLPNGHMTYERPYKSVDAETQNITNFASWLEDNEIDYFHVVIPAPVDPNMELEVQAEGYRVYSNRMADELIQGLSEKKIDVIDLREAMKEENKSYTDFFFTYEHHLIPEAGLWAAGKVSEHINELENISVDESVFFLDNYTITSAVKSNGLMNDSFWIYEGKERIDFLHPEFETSIEKYVADYDMTITGTFDEVIYADWDYPTYNTWNHNIKAIKTYRNQKKEDTLRILLLTESYSDVISPFLACAYAEIDELDLRIFSGSVQNYIEETKPDLVISMYSAYDFNAGGTQALYEFQ